jgi:hypothetical protein
VRRGADLALVQPVVGQLDWVHAEAPLVLLVEHLEAVTGRVQVGVDREQYGVAVAQPGDLKNRRPTFTFSRLPGGRALIGRQARSVWTV